MNEPFDPVKFGEGLKIATVCELCKTNLVENRGDFCASCHAATAPQAETITETAPAVVAPETAPAVVVPEIVTPPQVEKEIHHAPKPNTWEYR